jgi:hypothetical protein
VRRQIPELGSDHVLDDAAFPEGECFSVAIAARAAEIAVGVAKARDLDMKVAAARRRQLPFAEQGWLALAFEHEVVVADVVPNGGLAGACFRAASFRAARARRLLTQ